MGNIVSVSARKARYDVLASRQGLQSKHHEGNRVPRYEKLGGAGNPFAEALIQHLGKSASRARNAVNSFTPDLQLPQTLSQAVVLPAFAEPMLGVCKEVVSWTAALRRACQTNCSAR